jgi:hypothetical protein
VICALLQTQSENLIVLAPNGAFVMKKESIWHGAFVAKK